MKKTYLTKEMLQSKNIIEYLPKMANELTEEQIDNDDEFVVYNADDFRQGVCHLFAYELNQKYDYPMYIIKRDNTFHVFCKSKDNKLYIDVRGITNNFCEFISGTVVKEIEVDASEKYEIEYEDLNEKYADEYREFARIIIQEGEHRYQIENVN